MTFLRLDKPLVFFDLESTGLNPRTDRIIELSAIRLHPDGRHFSRTWLLNPTIPIPLETIAIHGITDDLVKDAPTFQQKAEEIFAFFRGCDLGGFGIGHLDVPLLEEEFNRVGMHFNVSGRRQFDALRGSERDRSMSRFRDRLQSIKSPADKRLRSERERLYNKVRQLEQDIALLENNIGFFSKSKNAEAVVADIREKIAASKQQLQDMIEKVRMIDSRSAEEEPNGESKE